MVLFCWEKEIARALAPIRSPRESDVEVTGGHCSGKSPRPAKIPNLHEYKTALLRANLSESTRLSSGLTALLNGIDDPAFAPLADYVATSPRRILDAADVSTMLLSALRQPSADRTVVVLDDVEQMDPASQIVLGFVARRLAGTGPVLIVRMRDEVPGSPFARMATLHLENLSRGDTVRMLESLTPGQIGQAAMHALASATHGIPLASISGLLPRAWRAGYLLILSCRSNVDLLAENAVNFWAGVDKIDSAGIAVRTAPCLRIQNQMLRAHIFSARQPAERTEHHHALTATAEPADHQAWPSLGGAVRIGRTAYRGISCSARDRTLAGACATVGMGAAVFSNVPEGETWVAIPAHETDREPYGFGSEQ